MSDGGVHSHITHLYALLETAKEVGLKEVYIHFFGDGRDTAPRSAAGYLKDLLAFIGKEKVGEVATIVGRYYAMDRDKNWDRVEKAYLAIRNGEGRKAASAEQAMESSYAEKVYDEFIVPTVIDKNGEPTAKVQDGDSVIFFNFRPDRAREMTRAFCDEAFTGFDRGPRPAVLFTCFVDYDETIENKQDAMVSFTVQSCRPWSLMWYFRIS